jgi:hypothetical protein
MSTAATPMVWSSLLIRIRPMLSFSVAGDHALQPLAAALTLPKTSMKHRLQQGHASGLKMARASL